MGETSQYREMTLPHFMAVFDYERDKLLELCRSVDWEGKIAFKVGRQWKIDVAEYLKWRKKNHSRDYKYAR